MNPFRYTSTLFIALLFLGTVEFAAAQNRITSPWGNPLAGAAASDVTASVARGGAGSLDTSFGENGIALLPGGPGTPGAGLPEESGLAVQSDGKILMVGRENADAAVYRMTPDGMLDENFGTGGIATLDLGTALDYFHSVAVQPDGKIVAVGTRRLDVSGNGDGAALARFLPDGTLDEDFGEGGLVLEPGTPSSDTPDAFWHVAVRPDGRIITTGVRGGFWNLLDERYACYATQYLPDGSRDIAFGKGGLVRIAPDEDFFCLDGDLMDDGRYVLGIVTDDGPLGPPSQWAVARVLPDGTLDDTFGDGGLAMTESLFSMNQGVVASPDGRVTLAGWTVDDGAGALLFRFTDAGEPDASFGTALGVDGLLDLFPGPGPDDDSVALNLALQPDGKLVVTGGGILDVGVGPFLVRLLPDGSHDPSFGNTEAEGVTFLDVSEVSEGIGIGYDVGFDAEGRILLSGDASFNEFPRRGFVARFENDVTPVVLPGGLDLSFGTDGVTRFESGVPIVASVAFQPDGKILTGGHVEGDAAVVRFNTDGSFDESFGTDGIATTDLGGTLDAFLSLAVQDDGKIVAAGSIFLGAAGPDGDGAALARFNADGTLDTSFGTDGIILEPGTPESGTPDAFWHVAVRPTGEIVAAGSQGIIFVAVEANACYAAQYLPDGSLDTGFGDGGFVSTIPDEDVFCLDAELLDDGRYVLGVNVAPEPFSALWGAVRLLPDGSHDASYGEGGVFVLDEAAPLYSPSMTAGPDGSTTHGSLGDDLTTRLVRFSSDGTLDTSYGEGGFAILDGLGTAVPWDLALQPDGKILMSGFDLLANDVRVPFLARAGADGTIDTSFGADGEGVTYIDLSSSDTRRGTAYKLGLDDENRIVVSGIVDTNASPVEGFVARFENDVTVSVEALATPEQPALAAPYPNPTHSTATLEFVLSEATDVRLTLYDILGREVAVVAEGARGAGTHTATLDTSRLASGLYVVRLTVGGESASQRLTVVR